MMEKDNAWRVYTTEFKIEAAAPAGKHRKAARQCALDLGINEHQLYRWIQRAREAAGPGLPPFSGHGRVRDEERSRLRKEVKTAPGGGSM